jgi:hypothetical protein
MAKTKGTGKGPSGVVGIRLPEEEKAFYQRKANESGLSLSAYLSQLLVKGVISENVMDIEDRLRSLIHEIALQSPVGGSGRLPDNALLSLFTCENLLTAIVEARDPQQLYAARDKAKAKLKRDKELS